VLGDGVTGGAGKTDREAGGESECAGRHGRLLECGLAVKVRARSWRFVEACPSSSLRTAIWLF
jgi:hypothetical protein